MYKQKLIDHLYQYTSKDLSFGCEVVVETLDGYGGHDTIRNKPRLNARDCKSKGLPEALSGSYYGERGYIQPDFKRIAGLRDKLPTDTFRLVEILGHPPQWHHLLLALGTNEWALDGNGKLWKRATGLAIKLNLTTNLQDIPEKDAEKLVELLNLE